MQRNADATFLRDYEPVHFLLDRLIELAREPEHEQWAKRRIAAIVDLLVQAGYVIRR